MPKPRPVTLANLAGGDAEKQFQRCLRQVHDNVNDPNTKPEAARKITLTLTFRPGSEREMSFVQVDSKVGLAANQPKVAQVFFGTEHGEPVVTNNDLNQGDLLDGPAEVNAPRPALEVHRG
jgi:hypothetical protein